MNLVVIVIYAVVITVQFLLLSEWKKDYEKLFKEYKNLVEECHKQQRIIDWAKHYANIDTVICIEEMEKEK